MFAKFLNPKKSGLMKWGKINFSNWVGKMTSLEFTCSNKHPRRYSFNLICTENRKAFTKECNFWIPIYTYKCTRENTSDRPPSSERCHGAALIIFFRILGEGESNFYVITLFSTTKSRTHKVPLQISQQNHRLPTVKTPLSRRHTLLP